PAARSSPGERPAAYPRSSPSSSYLLDDRTFIVESGASQRREGIATLPALGSAGLQRISAARKGVRNQQHAVPFRLNRHHGGEQRQGDAGAAGEEAHIRLPVRCAVLQRFIGQEAAAPLRGTRLPR